MAFRLSAAEKEIIAAIQEQFGITELEAVEQHLAGKRHLAFIQAQRGNLALAEHLIKELDEWNDEMRDELKRISDLSTKRIILP